MSIFKAILNQSSYSLGHHAPIESKLKNSLHYVQRMGLERRLEVHTGCVNTVHWNSEGSLLLSGSDDLHLVISNPFSGRMMLKIKMAHEANIFGARFLPHSNDHSLISCSLEGLVSQVTVRNSIAWPGPVDPSDVKTFQCHKYGAAHDVVTLPGDPAVFMSCGEDGTVRLFDLRVTSSCSTRGCRNHVLVNNSAPVKCMEVSPLSFNYLAVGGTDGILHVFDRRRLSVRNAVESTDYTVPLKSFSAPRSSARGQHRVTGLKYSRDESELLVSLSGTALYIYNMKSDGYVAPSEAITEEQPSVHQILGTRLLVDWSDTGPLARPTDWLNDSAQQSNATVNPVLSGASATNAQLPPSQGSDPVVGESAAANAQPYSVSSGQTTRDAAGDKALPPFIVNKYTGHRNVRTMLKEVAFWGDNYVMCGSDCGHIFVWERSSGKLVKLLVADKHVVNTLQPHPSLPYLASSGIDYDVKIWAPVLSEQQFDEEEAEELIKRNAKLENEAQQVLVLPGGLMRLLQAVRNMNLRQNVGLSNGGATAAGGNNNSPDEAAASE